MAAQVLPATAYAQFPGIEALGGFNFLHGEPDAALTINLEYLDLNLIAFGQFVTNFFDAFVRYLRDVYQAIFTRQDRNEGAEVH